MSKKKTIGIVVGTALGAMTVSAHVMRRKSKKTTYEAESIDSIKPRKMGFYEKYIKRAMDVVCATGAIVCFSPLYVGVAILVKLKLGSPVLFTQDRPGVIGKDGKETVFKMYKFAKKINNANGTIILSRSPNLKNTIFLFVKMSGTLDKTNATKSAVILLLNIFPPQYT